MDTLNHTPTSGPRPSRRKKAIVLMSAVAGLVSSGSIHAQQNPDPVHLSVTTEIDHVTRPVQDIVRKILDSYGNELLLLGGGGALALMIRGYRNRRNEEDGDTSFLESDLMTEYFDGTDAAKTGGERK